MLILRTKEKISLQKYEGNRTMSKSYNIALSFATENQELVEKVYHYLKAEGLSVFFAPAPECQAAISGENQREVFYNIFGLEAEYVALFVSKHYIVKEVPMEEANIAITKHNGDGKVVPVYLDEARLPLELLDPHETNYFRSNSPVAIASHLAEKIKGKSKEQGNKSEEAKSKNTMNIYNNRAEKQVFIQNVDGSIEF